ncbi:UDP-GlcNAc:betaGal beta-1,3-N-acetylglucosaminyltransferase 7-like, partial [Notechis scutatus]|uniref:Hexosyltransferase n=1 Tax=Notechis scutatus TaxID=8663 RepID=A0A6J1W582_9SAUR
PPCFSGDDDLFVNPKALTDYLRRSPNASRFIHGNIQHASAVMRRGKYAVPRELYPLDYYPNFASGGGFIMPRQRLPALHRASLALPVFPLDDVYLGFLALLAQIPHRHDQAFKVWGIPKDELPAYREAISIHGVSLERMEEVWKQLEEPPKETWAWS